MVTKKKEERELWKLVLEQSASKVHVIQSAENRFSSFLVYIGVHARHAIVGHLLRKILKNKRKYISMTE